MNKKNIVSLILLDVILLVIAIALFTFRYYSITKPLAVSIQQVKTAHTEPRKDMSLSIENEKDRPKVSENAPKRNVEFIFRHSKIKKVEIVGDFNDWIPQKLKKGKDFKWAIKIPLAPGDYAYNFVADGKPIRDPNNSKVCDAGRGFPNSYLKVNPLEPK